MKLLSGVSIPLKMTELISFGFAIKFSTIAIFFILFDIELVFVWPLAAMFRHLGWFGFVEMVVFLGILMPGFLYIWKKRGLEWE